VPNILFTKSDRIGSKIICGVTKEQVSHVALEYNGYVIHSNFCYGVNIQPTSKFKKDNNIVFQVPIRLGKADLLKIISENIGRRYDYLAFVMIALRYLHILPKKVDIRGISGALICTEFLTKILTNDERLLTPGQLYKELTK